MDTKKSASYKHLTLLPDDLEKVSLFTLLNDLISTSIGQSKFVKYNISEGKENKHLHTKMIVLSLIIQVSLNRFAWAFKLFRFLFEDIPNGNFSLRKNERLREEESDNYITFIGRLDTRKELNKDIKREDARYYPALSMMASKLVYENQAVIRKIVSQHWKMEFVKFFDCYNAFQKKATTQAFIMHERTLEDKDKKIIVAFRGTSPFDADDWRTDFDYSWCKLNGIGKIHKGFMIALGLKIYFHEDKEKYGDYSGYFPKNIKYDPNKPLAYYVIRDKLKEIMKNNNGAKFIVTGHSLGGALAILFPTILALHGEVELLDKLEGIYTFGQPRVGNEKFGNFMKKTFKKHNIKYYRIVYGYDIIPKVPLDNSLMSFKHFGPCIHFNTLYQGKIVEEEQQRAIKNNEKEGNLKIYLKLFREVIWFLIARLIAMWELIRGIIIGFTAGPYYREGWLLTAFRILPGLILPELLNHNPQDYVNLTMLASEDLFTHYHALQD